MHQIKSWLKKHYRLLMALGIGLLATFLTYYLQGTDYGFIDLWLAHGSAQKLLAGQDPYSYPTNGWPSNPLTTILVLIPFAALPLTTAAPIIFGTSTGLLVYGMLSNGEMWRLWTLLSFPYVFSMILAQWSPLMLAILFLPSLYSAILIKPHIGLGIGITHFTIKRSIITGLLFCLTFLVDPDWVFSWVKQIGNYDGFIPSFVFPGILIVLLALFFIKTPRGRYFILFCFTPQRLWYDQLLLWWLPRSNRSMIWLTFSSWIIGILYFASRYGLSPRPGNSELAIFTIYIPALCALFIDDFPPMLQKFRLFKQSNT